jgi:FixJ family two-component response regulator
VVITDQKMPAVTGEQLAVVIHRIRPGTPVILVTGVWIDDEYALPEGVTALLRKPVSSEAILSAVDGVLHNLA